MSDTSEENGRLIALPKAHLHLHLVGGMSRQLFGRLCERVGAAPVAFPVVYDSFAHFDEIYGAITSIVRSDLPVPELIEDHLQQARRDGVVWTEIGVYPHTTQQLDDVLEAIQPYRNEIGIMLLGNRLRPHEIVDLAKLAADRMDSGVVSFGLAGPEDASSPAEFAAGFRVAREAGLIIAPHAGEMTGYQDVWSAIEHMEPDRIAHGVSAIYDSVLLRHLVDYQVCLDLCPMSNVAICGWRLEYYPLLQMLEAGIPCTLNTDDPLFLDTTLVQEYALARDQMGLSDAQLAQLARYSIIHSGAPQATKDAALIQIEAWLQDVPAATASGVLRPAS